MASQRSAVLGVEVVAVSAHREQHVLTNILNPKVGVFYATFLPLLIPAGVNVMGFSMLLASIHVAEGILWFALLTRATRPLAPWFGRPGIVTTLDQATGAVLVGFGLRLALERGR